MSLFRQTRQTEVQRLTAKHAAEDAIATRDDIKAVMATPAGRRLFMRLLTGGGIYRRTQADDDHRYADGRRDAALDVMAAVNASAQPEAMQALQESNAVAERRRREIEAAMIKDNQKE